MGTASNDTAKLKLKGQIWVTMIVLAFAIFMLLCPQYNMQDWAKGVLGVIIGFWLR